MKRLTLLLIIALGLFNQQAIAGHKQHDYRNLPASNEIHKMQDFHLKNAVLKLQQEQPAYAWGDLAYVLCKIPNHHVALQHMTEISAQLHKEKELRNFFENALALFPEDTILQNLYNKFIAQTQASINHDLNNSVTIQR